MYRALWKPSGINYSSGIISFAPWCFRLVKINLAGLFITAVPINNEVVVLFFFFSGVSQGKKNQQT